MYGRRPGGNGVPGGPRGAQRSTSGSGYSRQNAAPYSRPSPAQRTPSHNNDNITAPPQVSIRGASSIPTQVVVSNLASGTTDEDLRQALQRCGEIIRVRERVSPGSRKGSTYEVLFEDRRGAMTAVKQFHGAYADEHLLEVVIEEEPRQTVVVQQTKAAPPTGPRAVQNGNGNGADTGRSARTLAPQATNNGPAALTQKERKALAKAQQVPLPTGPRAITPVTKSKAANVQAAKAAKAATSLASRLGGLPLAQRLGAVKGGSQSDLATLEANKSKKAAKRQAKAGSNAAPAAATTSAAPSRSKIQREKRKAKAAALRDQQQSGPSSESAMQLD